MPPSPSSPVWLITGTSTGIGHSLVLTALSHSQRVIATGRSLSRLQDLADAGAKTLEMDINASPETINQWVKETVLPIYGRIDVLVNNAGYVQLGTVEETGHEKLLAQYQTNVFAPLNLTRAILPHMRTSSSSCIPPTILMIGSVAAYQFLPAAGLYDSSKAALRALTTSLAAEVRDQGIRVCHVEPGMFRTAVFAGLGSPETHEKDPDMEAGDGLLRVYDEVRRGTVGFFRGENRKQKGDPVRLAGVLVGLVTEEGGMEGGEWPERLAVGSDCVDIIREEVERDLKRLEEWEDVSRRTDGVWDQR